jgi:UTP--glucose-1-phosphate uridylyltransferase
VTDPAPLVDLDSSYYKTIGAFEQRFPAGAPSLRRASELAVAGDWTFEDDVTVVGSGRLDDEGEPRTVPSGTVLGG